MLILNLLGNLGRDAEVKHIGDKDYISFSVASTEKQGENETTTWVSVLASNNPNLLPFLKKGQQVFVSGKMKAGIYQSQNSFGIDISVFAQALQLCGGKREDSSVAGGSAASIGNGITGTTAIPQPGSNGINTGQTVAPPFESPAPFPPAEEEQKDDLPF